MRLKALIFDVDGTLAETEEAHRTAFNHAFAEAGLDWSWPQDAYRELLTTTGGRERIARYMAEQNLAADPDLVIALHVRKNAFYDGLLADGQVAPRPGVVRLIETARRRDIALAIATTTSRCNLAALLDHAFGSGAMGWFSAIVAGEDVTRKKPHPEAYLRALAMLGLPAAACVAIEDSRPGLDSALAAGLVTVVTPSFYMSDQEFSGAAVVAESLAGQVDLAMIEAMLPS